MRKPVLLNAPLKDYLWGGKLLIEEYGKESDLEIVLKAGNFRDIRTVFRLLQAVSIQAKRLMNTLLPRAEVLSVQTVRTVKVSRYL